MSVGGGGGVFRITTKLQSTVKEQRPSSYRKMILLLLDFSTLVSGDALGDPIFRVPVAPLAVARLADASELDSAELPNVCPRREELV